MPVVQGETERNMHQKCNDLKQELNEAKNALHDRDRKIDGLKAERDQLRDKIAIMDERLVARDKYAFQQDLPVLLHSFVSAVNTQIDILLIMLPLTVSVNCQPITCMLLVARTCALLWKF
jgi:CII-binding regulator of phage lambda lysogenization HflD